MTLSRRMMLTAAASLPLAPVAAAADTIEAIGGNVQERLQRALDAAQAKGGEVRLGAGTFLVDMLDITKPVSLTGAAGKTVLRTSGNSAVLRITGATSVMLSSITFSKAGLQGDLVTVGDSTGVTVDHCDFLGGGNGISFRDSSGAVSNCHFRHQEQTGIFSLNAKGGLQVTANRLEDIGNNGIQIWREAKGQDGSQVLGNIVQRIAANAGGDGQNGNGINVYKAGNVMVANNRITDCAFSAVRNNSGDDCQIIANSISRMGEVTIYCEFEYQGAVVSNNLIEDVAFGISITNFREGGRLAVVSGNLIRKVRGEQATGAKTGGAISAEADTLITGNVVEGTRDFGINAGWGPYCRNVTISANTVKDCPWGITASVTEGAGRVIISDNTITGARTAISGFDHDTPKTGDLGTKGASPPAHITVSNNHIS